QSVLRGVGRKPAVRKAGYPAASGSKPESSSRILIDGPDRIAGKPVPCRIPMDRTAGEPSQAAAVRADPHRAAGIRIYRPNVPEREPVVNGKGPRNLAVDPMAEPGMRPNPHAPVAISADRENRVIG